MLSRNQLQFPEILRPLLSVGNPTSHQQHLRKQQWMHFQKHQIPPVHLEQMATLEGRLHDFASTVKALPSSDSILPKQCPQISGNFPRWCWQRELLGRYGHKSHHKVKLMMNQANSFFGKSWFGPRISLMICVTSGVLAANQKSAQEASLVHFCPTAAAQSSPLSQDMNHKPP